MISEDEAFYQNVPGNMPPVNLIFRKDVKDSEFVAVRVLGAVHTVGPDFLGKNILLNGGETDMIEEAFLIGEREHAFDANRRAVGKTCLDSQKSQPLASLILTDNK